MITMSLSVPWSLFLHTTLAASSPTGAAAGHYDSHHSGSSGSPGSGPLWGIPCHHHRQPGATSADRSGVSCGEYDASLRSGAMSDRFLGVLATDVLLLGPLRPRQFQGCVPHQPN